MSTPSFLDDKDFLSELDKNINLASRLLEHQKKDMNDKGLMKYQQDHLEPAQFELVRKRFETTISTLTDVIYYLNQRRKEDLENLEKREETKKLFVYLNQMRLNNRYEMFQDEMLEMRKKGYLDGGKKMRKTRKTMRKRNKKRRSSIRSNK